MRKYFEQTKLSELQSFIVNTVDLQFPAEAAFDEGLKEAPLYVNKADLIAVMKVLKHRFDFDMLCCVTAIDYKTHLEMAYDLVSRSRQCQLTVKVKLDKGNAGTLPQIDSLCALWPAADFQEREQYDLMGIEFIGHPNLERILLPDDFEGHPLRKDFKQGGAGR